MYIKTGLKRDIKSKITSRAEKVNNLNTFIDLTFHLASLSSLKCTQEKSNSSHATIKGKFLTKLDLLGFL